MSRGAMLMLHFLAYLSLRNDVKIPAKSASFQFARTLRSHANDIFIVGVRYILQRKYLRLEGYRYLARSLPESGCNGRSAD